MSLLLLVCQYSTHSHTNTVESAYFDSIFIVKFLPKTEIIVLIIITAEDDKTICLSLLNANAKSLTQKVNNQFCLLSTFNRLMRFCISSDHSYHRKERDFHYN